MNKDAKKEIIMDKKLKEQKVRSTFDEFVGQLTPQEKRAFDEEYRELVLSELLIAAMLKDSISVRKLAEAAGVSPTVIQGIRSGTRKNISVQSLFKVLDVLGYHLVAEKNGSRLPIDISAARK